MSGDAKTNARSGDVDTIDKMTVHLEAEDLEVVAEQPVDLQITSSNFNEVFGYQFTSRLNGLALNGVRLAVFEMNDTHESLPEVDRMSASWASDKLVSATDGEISFTIEFIPTRSGSLKELIQMNSEMTKAEANIGSGMDVVNIDLSFRSEVANEGVNILYQNEPNPFKGITNIEYELKHAGLVTFTMYDV